MQKFINNWSTTITQALSPSDTVVYIDVESANRLAVGFQPGDYYLLTLDDRVNVEIIRVNSISNNALSIDRAQEATFSRFWDNTSKVEARLTAMTLEFLKFNTDRILTACGEVLISPEGNFLLQ